jgi:hypothetical protein
LHDFLKQNYKEKILKDSKKAIIIKKSKNKDFDLNFNLKNIIINKFEND